ncbi:MAG: site-specific DNA-methyltransferase [Polyangiaceae bacterium]|nr:site-specific DNA-methyltransferase [Polyangiaceae bacterium]
MKKLTSEDPETRSADVVAENVECLRELFPEAFAEGRVDFEVLKQVLGGLVDEREERYGLNWHGKRRARQLALTPSTGTLRPCPEESVDWDTTQNLMIEGDNLEVLKLLQKSYAGKVKLIYIDPPYNTGKDFVYPDDFRDSIRNYLEVTGQVAGDDGRISSNSETSGRFHTSWLNMLYPRLKLARNLLREDGALFMSIDDNELDNALKLGQEVFGEENFVGLIGVQLNPRGRHLDRFLARTHEYLCVFAKNADAQALYSIPKDERMTAEYRKDDSRGRYRELELRNRNPAFNRRTRPNLYYPIYVNPSTGSVSLERDSDFSVEVFPLNSSGGDSCWTWGRDKLASDRDVVLGREVGSGGWRIYRKDYLLAEDGQAATTLPKSLWLDKSINNDAGKKAIQQLFGETVFDFPKAVALVEKVLDFGCGPDGVVLDFFAGSGTTGEAVMSRNAADSGNRKYILVQLPEPLDPDGKTQKAAATLCESLKKPLRLSELTKERLRRAGQKLREANSMFAGDLGFRVFKLDHSNIRAWDPSPDDLEGAIFDAIEHLRDGRTEQDVLYELLLKLGLDLCVPIEERTIAGKTVHSVGAGTLFVCLPKKVATDEVEPLALGIASWREELAPAGETTVVFRDSAFENDVAKTNLAAILEQHGLENVRSL